MASTIEILLQNKDLRFRAFENNTLPTAVVLLPVVQSLSLNDCTTINDTDVKYKDAKKDHWHPLMQRHSCSFV